MILKLKFKQIVSVHCSKLLQRGFTHFIEVKYLFFPSNVEKKKCIEINLLRELNYFVLEWRSGRLQITWTAFWIEKNTYK
jgi:hypothetical protein